MTDNTHIRKAPVTVVVRLGQPTVTELRRIAADKEESVSSVVRRLLRHGLAVERRSEAFQ